MLKKRYVMVIDLDKCLGCKTCTIACNIENSVSSATRPWNIVLDTIEGDYPEYKRRFLPRPCMHCSNEPCVDVCPTGASHRNDDLGLVLVNQKKCIGCRTCVSSCPYEARVFNWKKPEKLITENPAVPGRRIGVVEKCTFCVHKLTEAKKKGLQVGTSVNEKDNKKVVSPACVSECIGNARYFGDLNDPKSEVCLLLKNSRSKRLIEELKTEPNVYYLNLE